MLKIRVIAVGRLRGDALEPVAADYAKRISRFARFDEVEVKDGDAAQVTKQLSDLLDREAGQVVALEVTGKAFSSHDLAGLVRDGELHAWGRITFLIGGAYGLPRDISQRAGVRLSLGAITLPHRLARVVLYEQIYRAFTIVRGQPYSH